MSQTVERLRRRMSSAEELGSVTRTMKGLAAVHVRQFEQAASVVAEYRQVVERGLQIVLRDSPRGGVADRRDSHVAASGLVVLGSNQGLCGPINRRVATHARAWRDDRDEPTSRVAAVGVRLAVELEVAGVAVTDRLELPNTLENVAHRSSQLLVMLDEWRSQEPGLGVWLCFPGYQGRRGGYQPTTRQLLPVSAAWLHDLATRPWPTHVLPTSTMPRPALLAALLRERLLVELHDSLTQTLAAIAASRLAAMSAAERDIEERLEALRRQHHRLRQSQITEELLDFVSGFDVLCSDADT